MMKYAQGGLADVAQNLANKGRNGDTKLVHMSPKEVRGLQTLAKANGTSLTINPDTGLPEAFRLENLFPMIAGAALTATGVGAPLAALMVGGAYGAATGSIEKGLMAGIGAYGGAGLGTGLSAAGASTVAPTVAPTAVPELATQTASTVAPTAGGASMPIGGDGISGGVSMSSVPVDPAGFTPKAGTLDLVGESYAVPRNPIAGYAGTETGVVNPSVLPQTAANQPPTFANMGRGLEALGTSEGRSIAYKNMPMGTLPALGTTALMASQQTPNVPGYQEDEYDRRLKGYRLSPNYQPYEAPRPNPYYRPTYAAAGGVMNSFDDEAGMDMARGGIASLGGYSDGGRMLKGPGDGMSDSIPGVIGGKQPARLADGEFVVPADVVSHLGNGSTDAGAKKLYSMMDKIRQARTGKKKQAPQVNAEKYLPMKKMASGGIAGYARGGITGYAEGGSTYSNEQVASFIKDLQNKGGTESDIVAEAIRYGIPAKQISDATSVPLADISNKIVDQIYIQQLGRAPDEQGAKYYTEQLASGKTPAQIASELNRSLEGQNFDTQYITSLYRSNYQRNPEQEGYQYYMSLAQTDPLMFDAALKNAIINGTQGEADAAKLAAKGSGYTNLELAALEADPFGGRQATQSIYELLPDAVNVSNIGGQKAQFVNPATQKGIVSQFNQNYTDKNVSDYIQSKLLGVDVNDPVALQQANRSIYQDALSKNVSPEQISRVLPYTISQIQQFGTENLGKTLQSQYSANQGVDVLNAPANQAAVNRALAAGTLNQADYNTLTADLAKAKTADEIRAAYAKPQGQVVLDAIYGQQIGEAKTLANAQAEAAQRQAVLSAQDPGYYQSNQQLASAYKSAGLNFPFGQEAYQGYDTRVGAKNVITPQNVRQQAGLAINELQRNNPYRPTYQPINRGIANMPLSVQDPYSDAGLQFLYGNMMNQYAPAPLGQMNPATFTSGPTYAYTPPLVDNLAFKNPIADAATAQANQAKADAAAAQAGDANTSGAGNRAGGLMSIDRKKRAKYKT